MKYYKASFSIFVFLVAQVVLLSACEEGDRGNNLSKPTTSDKAPIDIILVPRKNRAGESIREWHFKIPKKCFVNKKNMQGGEFTVAMLKANFSYSSPEQSTCVIKKAKEV